MKKLLALVLALVMSMSLVTISNAAFKDADKIDYDEAVEVMNAVGVLVGDEKGNFNAKDNLTRAQAAKIISYLLLGNKTAEALAGSGKFTDVAKTSWFAGFVDYCASTGVVNGVGDGKFDPNGQLTGYQFAKMLLVALGYDAKIEGFTGADWQINVSKRADQADLFDGLDISGNAALTREQAAQMCLNTLKSPLVEYSNKGGNLTINGATINIGASNAEYKTSSTKLADQTIYANKLNSSAGEYIVEFAEQYYSDLVLKSGEADDFGRPAHTWLLNNQKVGTYAEDVDYEYTTAVTGKALYEALGKNTVETYDFSVFVDGAEKDAIAKEIAKNNKSDLTSTGNGVLTQVFVDNDKETVIISMVNTYLAKASADYNSKKDSVSLKIYFTDDGTTKTVDGEDLAISDIKDGDFLLVTYSYMTGVNKVESIAKPEAIEDSTIDSFKSGKNGNVTVAGTKYEYNKAAKYDADVLDKYTGESSGKQNLKDVTYNLFLDQYGYVIGVEEVETVKNYVFITGIDYNYSSIATKTITANAIFMDGTTKVIDVKNNDDFKAALAKVSSSTTATATATGPDAAKATINTWFTYTVGSNDVYSLTGIENSMVSNKNATNHTKVAQNKLSVGTTGTTTYDIDKKNISLGATGDFAFAYGNDATVYLSVNLDTVALENKSEQIVIKDVDSVTTGVKNVDITTMTRAKMFSSAKADSAKDAGLNNSVYFIYKDNGYIIAAVVIGEDEGSSKNLVYVTSDKIASESYNKTTGKWTWTREVAYNGEKVTLTETNDDGVSELKKMTDRYSWYEVKYNADGNVVSVEKASKAEANWTNSDYVNDVEQLVDIIRIKGIDTVLYEQGAELAKAPSLKGSTLYFDSKQDTGIVVADDVKYVYTQKVDNKWTTTYETGFNSLKTALDELNTTVSYRCSAIIENGIATIVTVYDATEAGYTPVDPAADASVTLDETATTIRYYGTKPTEDEAVATVEAAIADKGYTVTNRELKSGVYTWTVESKNGFKQTFVFTYADDMVKLFKVSIETNFSDMYKAVTSDTKAAYVANGEQVTVKLTDSDTWTQASIAKVSVTGDKNVTLDGNAKVVLADDSKGCTVEFTVKATADGVVTIAIV